MEQIEDFVGYSITEEGDAISFKGKKPKVLKKQLNKRTGYLHVNLRKDGITYNRTVHRLVAEAFIPNPLGLPEVNHKDEDKTNNAVSNLEWVTSKQNSNHGTHNERMKAHQHSKPVTATTKDGVWVGDYSSVNEAARQLGVFATHISQCCKGTIKQYNGFVFTYK